MNRTSRRLFVATTIAGATAMANPMPPLAAIAQEKPNTDKASTDKSKLSGIFVPAYFHPSGDNLSYWDDLVSAAAKVPLMVVINPNSGPGEKIDPAYPSVIAKLAKTKAQLLGYISTSYAKVPLEKAKADIAAWTKMYPEIQGYFLDEQTSDAGHVDYYRKLVAAAKAARPNGTVVSNPGNPCDAGYFAKGGPDVLCTFENSSPLAEFKGDAISAAANRRIGLAHSLHPRAKLEPLLDLAANKQLGWVFLTDGVMPNPWDRLPSFWDNLVAAVAARVQSA
jgi:hypothetical protein